MPTFALANQILYLSHIEERITYLLKWKPIPDVNLLLKNKQKTKDNFSKSWKHILFIFTLQRLLIYFPKYTEITAEFEITKRLTYLWGKLNQGVEPGLKSNIDLTKN